MRRAPIVEAQRTEAELVEDAVDLAARLLADSRRDETRAEARRRARLGALLADDDGRQLIFGLTDEVMRIDDPRLAAWRFSAIVDAHRGAAVGRLDAALLQVGALLAVRLPRIVMPLVRHRVRVESRGVVIPADEPAFARHLRRRAADDVSINVNPLGEAILSDAEADERMRSVLDRIRRADVDYVSVKVSAIVANLDSLAFDFTVERIADRLRELYRAAEGAVPRTFVNLDMEEYRDLELTLQSFMKVLDESEFVGIDAGIVLQAYLPDSHEALDRLGEWSARRHASHGGTVKVRLVKGANLAMEQVEASMRGWLPAPYGTKAEVDASYKAMFDSALRPQWAQALRIGFASHNLFDIAWALTIGADRGVLDRIEFEMLEGMAPAQARAVHRVAGHLLMYAPVVANDDFDACIAYLTRRLDENTQPENFLRSLFTLAPGTPAFVAEADRFRTSVEARHQVFRGRRRARVDPTTVDGFVNEPDSDTTDPFVRFAFVQSLATPPNPSYRRVDSIAEVDDTIAAAARAVDHADLPERRGWLLAAAEVMGVERASTVGLMAHVAAKTIHEGDPEVSEAVDFCRYYATEGSARLDEAHAAGCEVGGRGTVAVIGPWNFPYAIPTGGVAAAIAAGNSVILKPAPEVVSVGARIVEQFWKAGVPRDVLQLVVCDDGPVGRRLVTHPDVDTVVLTGAHETASMFLGWRPGMRLFAETSGKNALVITPSADIDLAIGDLVRSAFGHAGQKCSAASLGIVVAEVYDDPTFRRRLRDAVASLRVGSAADPATIVGPLIAPPAGKLERALTVLDPGETWLVEPRSLDIPGTTAGTSWSPGVRAGVRAGSWFHRTECFGPVLGLMRADDLDHAIELQNAGDYGLTGGIHSLDGDEIDRWLAKVEVGNAYVNRHITGAIVRRQPFGGWKRSSVGGGAKAGGPGYVSQFARIADPLPPTLDGTAVRSAMEAAWRGYFCVDHDETGLAAEANVLRYRPLDRVEVRHGGDVDRRVQLLRIVADVTGVELVESSSSGESDEHFARRLAGGAASRVRLLTDLSANARRMLHAADVPIDLAAPVAAPCIELPRWVREQAISRTLHRHGRL